MNQDQLIQAWYNAQTAKAAAVEAEKTLRLQVAEEVFGYDPDELPTGTFRHPLPNSWKAKISFKVNESLEQSEVARVREELQRQKVPVEIVAGLFKPKWTLVKAFYNTLSPNAKELVDLITNRSSATPTLELEPPKEGATTKKKGRK